MIMNRAQGAALTPLSNEQKQKLAAMARYAWIEMGPDQDFNDWRHEEVMRTVGKAGLRECCNEDYNPLKARWLDMCGHVLPALRAARKSVTEPREWALFSLYKEATDAKDVMPEAMKYARGMIRRISGATLEDAPENLIWRAVYAVRRKAQKERRIKKGGESAGSILDNVLGGRIAKPAPIHRQRHVKGPF